jgi:hypothetical protein
VPFLTAVSYIDGPFMVVDVVMSCAQTPADIATQANVHNAARKMDIRLLLKFAFAMFSSLRV